MDIKWLILVIGVILCQGCAGATAESNVKAAKSEQSATLGTNYTQGKMLYENHCGVCHDSRVHIRENHKSKSTDDVRYWVTRWSSHLKLSWSSDEISQVVNYLSARYYHFKAAP